MLLSIIKLLPNLARGALIGGAAVNEGADQVVTQITGAPTVTLLVLYMVVAAIELVSRYLKHRSDTKNT